MQERLQGDARVVVVREELGRSAVVVAMMTLISRLFGFVRDVMVAHLFGATAAVDAFWVAFKIPNFLRRLFAEGAFQQAFVPVLSEYRQTKDLRDIKDFIDNMAGLLTLVTFAVTLIGVLAAPLLVTVFAPGFLSDPIRFDYATDMIRWTFPYLFFISLTAFSGSILNSFGRFAVPAFTPVLLNIAMIGSALTIAPAFSEPVYSLAIGVFIGGILQLLLQWPFLKHMRLWPRLAIHTRHAGVVKVLKLMLPAIFGVSVAQISLLLNTLFASFLQVGSVSWLYYSDRLTAFPLGIFGVGIATVILPLLSRRHAVARSDDFNHTLLWATRIIWVIALPSAVGLVVCAGPILATLFGYGEFTSFDVDMTRLSLMALALGIPAFMLIKVYATGFYAQQDIKTPVRYAAITMLVTIVLNAALILPLKHAGLALATTLGAGLNVGLLWRGLHRRGLYRLTAHSLVFMLKITVGCVLMGSTVWFVQAPLADWLAWPIAVRVGHLFWLLISAIIVYFLTIIVLGVRWRDIKPPGK